MIARIIKLIKDREIAGETVRYVIIGGITTLVSFCLFAAMTKLMNIDITISNVVSISVTILIAYVMNKLIVFRQRGKTGAGLLLEFVKFVGSRLFTMALDVGVVLLFVDVFGQDELIGKTVSLVLVVIGNYFISKIIVFTKT